MPSNNKHDLLITDPGAALENELFDAPAFLGKTPERRRKQPNQHKLLQKGLNKKTQIWLEFSYYRGLWSAVLRNQTKLNWAER